MVPKIGDVVETLAGLPVGTWVRGRRGRLWCVLTYEIYKAGDVPHSVDYIPGADGMGYGPFTICRPPVGAVLPSARYAPEGTWLRDCDGDICHAPPDPSVTAPDRYAPFTVIADPREAPEPDDVVYGDADMERKGDRVDSYTVIDEAQHVRDGAGVPVAGLTGVGQRESLWRTAMGDTGATVPARVEATKALLESWASLVPPAPDAVVEGGPSPVARMLANMGGTSPRRMTWGDAEGATSRRVAPRPEPMPRVDLITTGGDQSWRKARPVSRRLGRVEPVCGWSSYYGGE